MGGRWTEEAVLGESERWVHVPRGGARIEDERRLLVHYPERWGTSRVWRSWPADERRADELVGETVDAVRAAGGRRLVWHTGDRVAPPFMDECLARRGFRETESLEVLAFPLIDGREPRLPRIKDSGGVAAELVCDPEVLQEALLVDSEIFGSPLPSGEEFAEYAGELEKLRRRGRGEQLAEGASLALRFVAYAASGAERGRQETCTVAAAGAEIVGETIRLWGAGTRVAFRGQGAYGRLVVERCRVGGQLGATLALTKANTTTSAPILRRAGFRLFGAERRHMLEVR